MANMNSIYTATVGLMVGTATVFCSSGCEKTPQRVPVAGRVLLDGQPLEEGSVRFVPAKGRPVGGQIQSDGTFTLVEQSLSAPADGIAPGNYRVAVTAMHVVDENAGDVEWLTPQKYADHHTSDLQVSIDGPVDNLVLALTSDAADDLSGDAAGADAPVADQDATQPDGNEKASSPSE